MNELQEIKQMVTEQMETTGSIRPTLFLVGEQSRFGFTCTSYPSELDDAISPMCTLGKRLAAENSEIGRLLRVYFAAIALFTSRSKDFEPREVLTIHGVDVATNKQTAVVFEVLRDRSQNSLPFQKLEELHNNAPVPEHPALQAFVNGYLSFD
jgi:hypothetical protein